MSHLSVVIGVDSSESSAAALRLGAAEAAARRLPVTLVHAWVDAPLYEGAALPVPPAGFQQLSVQVEAAARSVLESATEELTRLAPTLRCEPLLVPARPETALVAASTHAALVVLGRHTGRPSWLGPVLSHVPAEAHCPVLVVPAGQVEREGRVVVGVDGSPVSTAALSYAAAQAERWNSELVAVLSVQTTFDVALAPGGLREQLHERGRRELAEALAGTREEHPDLVVHAVVSLDNALPVLLQSAQHAGLLVVGSHGRGPLRRAVLGSVSAGVLRAAPCPVAVVRPVAGHDEHGHRHASASHGWPAPVGSTGGGVR